MIEITLSQGGPINLKPASEKAHRGLRIPGASLLLSKTNEAEISIHMYEQPLFTLLLLNIHCPIEQTVTIRFVYPQQRLEYSLTGQWTFEGTAKGDRFLPGHCRICSDNPLRFHFEEGCGGELYICLFSQELVQQMPIAADIKLTPLMPAASKVRDVIDQILRNPFERQFRNGFYDYMIRKLLFYHAASPPYTPPGQLTPTELSAIYAADAIICANLDHHYSIEDLAMLTGTNTQVIKKGFKQVFGMGTFKRRQFKKMEHAIFLLETTDLQVQEIALAAGYETVTGFVHAFSDQFRYSPADWRKQNRK